MADLKGLKHKRTELKKKLTRFITFLQKCDAEFLNNNITQLETRLSDAIGLLESFNDIQSEIEAIDETEESEENEKECVEFENRFYENIAKAKFLIETYHKIHDDNTSTTSNGSQNINSIQNNPHNSQQSASNHMNFPQFELPKFYGEYENWAHFRDMFVSLIENNQTLDQIKKFYYLKNCLKGKAQSTIENIDVTADNYLVAWELLKNRYENKYVIIKNHNSALIECEPVNMKDFLAFLENRCLLMELNQVTTAKSAENNQNFFKKKYEKALTSYAPSNHDKNTYICPCCQEPNHAIYQCEKFKNMNINARIEQVKRLKLCMNCFRKGHNYSECRAQKCKKCNNNHNTLLHFQNENKELVPNENVKGGNTVSNNIVFDANEQPVATYHCSSENKQILLSTAVIYIRDAYKNWHSCRALLDSGSQPNFMTTKLHKLLNLPSSKVEIPVLGIGSAASNIEKSVSTQIKSIVSKYQTNLSFLIIDNITDKLPTIQFDMNILKIPKNIILADPKFNIPNNIDILLGAGIFYELLGKNRIKLGENLPILQSSELGYLISGNCKYGGLTLHCNFAVSHAENLELKNAIEKFWQIENVPNKNHFNLEEQECEELFKATTTRALDGKFIITLPTNNKLNQLSNNFNNALKRFDSIEKKLTKNSILRLAYNKFMAEYEALGHMVEITPETQISNQHTYYLPHHCIANEIKNKFRVVFDGSSKSVTGISLNDVLKVGPTLQDNLFNILIRFRCHSIVLVGDVEKMYRMIYINKEQTNLQRIVWRSNVEDSLKHYQLLTITYGTSSAAYQAIRCLQQIAIDNENEYPELSNIILRDFYVDDLVTGANTVEEIINLKEGLTKLMEPYGFHLRK